MQYQFLRVHYISSNQDSVYHRFTIFKFIKIQVIESSLLSQVVKIQVIKSSLNSKLLRFKLFKVPLYHCTNILFITLLHVFKMQVI